MESTAVMDVSLRTAYPPKPSVVSKKYLRRKSEIKIKKVQTEEFKTKAQTDLG